jgi:hypothetical protein
MEVDIPLLLFSAIKFDATQALARLQTMQQISKPSVRQMSEVAPSNPVISNASPHSSPLKRGRSGSVTVPPLSLSPPETEAFVEPILRPNPHRFTLFPVLKPKLFAKYKDHQSVMWIPEEIDLSKDMKDWVKLTKEEQYFIRNILGFFAGSDGIVQENLAMRFTGEVQIADARAFYAIQNAIEQIHSETYSRIIDVLLGAFATDPVAVVTQNLVKFLWHTMAFYF